MNGDLVAHMADGRVARVADVRTSHTTVSVAGWHREGIDTRDLTQWDVWQSVCNDDHGKRLIRRHIRDM